VCGDAVAQWLSDGSDGMRKIKEIKRSRVNSPARPGQPCNICTYICKLGQFNRQPHCYIFSKNIVAGFEAGSSSPKADGMTTAPRRQSKMYIYYSKICLQS
jgi:hypothetical protein